MLYQSNTCIFAFLKPTHHQKNNDKMKTILFPTDFSSNATHASLYAAMLARRLNAKIVLLHSYAVPMVSVNEMAYDVEFSFLESEKIAQKDLAVFTENFIKDTKLSAERVTQRVEVGLLVDSISSVIKSSSIDMIVMGTEGANNSFDQWLGTNTQDIIASVHCPVWVIPENATLTYPTNIMYAADFKENEIAATNQVLEFAQYLVATCNVVHIHEYYDYKSERIMKEMIADLEKEFKGNDITFKNFHRQDIVKALENYIKTHKPDVLAMAVHEKSFLSNLFFTSISKHFIQEAKLPMLIFRK
jgi:nucleotide-binding universal stress UspA family protein